VLHRDISDSDMKSRLLSLVRFSAAAPWHYVARARDPGRCWRRIPGPGSDERPGGPASLSPAAASLSGRLTVALAGRWAFKLTRDS
jgi:hypothetical protein